jgi:hypothetical protein
VPNGRVQSNRIEADLRARLTELEARLADVSRCLEDAEQRAGELLATQARAALLEQRIAVILTSRSWRLTTPLRRGMKRARGSGPR